MVLYYFIVLASCPDYLCPSASQMIKVLLLRLVRSWTHWLLTGTMGELENRSVAPPLLWPLPTDWVLGDTLGV